MFDVSADPFLLALCVCFCVCMEGLRRLSSIYGVGQWQDQAARVTWLPLTFVHEAVNSYADILGKYNFDTVT